MRILCKMSPNQNYREFFCKIFCWRSPNNLKGNSFLKFKRNNFRNNFLVKKYSMVIIGKIIPEQKYCVVPDPNPHASLVRAVYEA